VALGTGGKTLRNDLRFPALREPLRKTCGAFAKILWRPTQSSWECDLLTPRFDNLHDRAYSQKGKREDIHSPILRLMEQLGNSTHLDGDIVEAGSTSEGFYSAGNQGVETQTVGAAK
jgi:hypothetical protein